MPGMVLRRKGLLFIRAHMRLEVLRDRSQDIPNRYEALS